MLPGVVFATVPASTPTLSAISQLAEAAIMEKMSIPANARVEVNTQSLDSRVNPPRCLGAIEAELASDREISRNNTVKISCNSPDLDYPWQIYLSVRVDILYPVVVATKILTSGELITEEHIEVRFIEQHSLRGQQFTDTTDIIGTRTKRRVGKDAAIFANNICFVCKGDIIAIYARTEKILIKTTGEALKDGNINDNIRVKNTSSNKILDARVTGVGEVEVKM
jgi:flagellar basal body P-ring formation protein FlgA